MAKEDDAGDPLESNVDFAGVQARQQGVSAAAQKGFPLPLLGFVASFNGIGGAVVLGGGASGFTFTVSPGNVTMVSPSPTPYTPTVTAGAGAFTTASAVGHSTQIGQKVYFVRLTVTITTNGTAATDVRATLPFITPNDQIQILNGIESGLTGKSLQGYILPNTSTVIMRYDDTTYPGGTSGILTIEGILESA